MKLIKQTIGSEAGAPLQIRDRIKELRRIRAGDLVPNPKNWRVHTKAQQEALCGLLKEVGYADALLVRELEDGRLIIIDGHLRAQTTPDIEVPVLLLYVTAEEADLILVTLDPLAAMAESNVSPSSGFARWRILEHAKNQAAKNPSRHAIPKNSRGPLLLKLSLLPLRTGFGLSLGAHCRAEDAVDPTRAEPMRNYSQRAFQASARTCHQCRNTNLSAQTVSQN